MDVKINSKNMDVGDALAERISNELPEAVEKYFEGALEGTATLTRQNKRFTTALRVHVARGTFVESSASAGDAHAAFDGALERVAKQLRRYKRKLVSAHHHPTPAQMGMEMRDTTIEDDPDSEEAELGGGNDPITIAETTIVIPTLTVSGAVMRMDLSDRPVLFFRHAGNDRLNAIYRRPDGNVGWIDPAEEN
jgi:ribosomal subunit interface protein